MIDPEIRQKVMDAAAAAARRSGKVDVAALWKRLEAIQIPEFFQSFLDSTLEYQYGALPISEPPGSVYSPTTPPRKVIGIDGSQVYPDWQQPVLWAYIQALGYSKLAKPYFASDFIDLGSQRSTAEKSDLSFGRGNDLEDINFWRTVLEMRVAYTAANENADNVILMDYPLLPWIGSRGGEALMESYLQMIEGLRGKLVAGVVSAPKSKLLVSLVALSDTLHGRESVPPNVSDEILINKGLQPGQRSAIFTYAGPRNEICKKRGIEICFFFIRVKGLDVLRIEIPAWLADDANLVDIVHASVLEDSIALGYPYVLAAAHQNVVIPMDVGDALRQLALDTYLREGGFYYVSAKMRAKGVR